MASVLGREYLYETALPNSRTPCIALRAGNPVAHYARRVLSPHPDRAAVLRTWRWLMPSESAGQPFTVASPPTSRARKIAVPSPEAGPGMPSHDAGKGGKYSRRTQGHRAARLPRPRQQTAPLVVLHKARQPRDTTRRPRKPGRRASFPLPRPIVLRTPCSVHFGMCSIRLCEAIGSVHVLAAVRCCTEIRRWGKGRCKRVATSQSV